MLHPGNNKNSVSKWDSLHLKEREEIKLPGNQYQSFQTYIYMSLFVNSCVPWYQFLKSVTVCKHKMPNFQNYSRWEMYLGNPDH